MSDHIKIENLSKLYDKILAVNKVSFDVKKGETLAIVGPSGCGKTTLLRLIAGLVKPTEGKILFHGECVNNWEPRKRNIAMVFQNYALYPHKTIRENLEYPLKLRNIPRIEINDKVLEISHKLLINSLLEKKPSELSGGQQQRAALGRAIIRQTDLFLFDEPLSNLDAQLRDSMRIELKKIIADLGVTSLYVTHDQQEAIALGDLVLVMNDGEIQQIDTSSNIFFQPDNIFTAKFFGRPEMNILRNIVFNSDDMQIEISKSVQIKLESDSGILSGQYDIGIRPSDIFIEDIERRLTYLGEFIVEFIENNITYNIVECSNDNTKLKLLTNEKPKLKSLISLYIDPKKIHIFSSETGNRIPTAIFS
ncbi:MAG: ABC transporter ATP-binding protein [candidate division Zixibacteria bacterium]|nr:ABC transporter ATP-binding protein [candidate division Zixibacteria bacterium]